MSPVKMQRPSVNSPNRRVERRRCQRKWAVEESPKGKKKVKKVRMEPETGPSGEAALGGLQTSSRVVENFGDLMRGVALVAGLPECVSCTTGAAKSGGGLVCGAFGGVGVR